MEHDRRKVSRQRTLKGVGIAVHEGFSTFTCRVRNFSPEGARLKLASVIGIPDSFRLVFDDGRSFNCSPIWKREGEMGVRFA